MSPISPTYYIIQLNVEEFVQGIFRGDKHTKVVLQRLDRLTLDETRTTAAEILKVVYGLIQDTSKQTYCTCFSLAIEHPSHQMAKHLVMPPRMLLVRFVGNSVVPYLSER